MDNIDTIYYSGTSIDQTTGYITDVSGNYFIPFLDFYLVLGTFTFTVILSGLIYLIFKRKK
jgi:hypothetical protein